MDLEIWILADKRWMRHQSSTLPSLWVTWGSLSVIECLLDSNKALATFQELMQNCMGELNFIYCLIYLDDLIVFSWTAEEHLHQLHVVFNCLREYNLKLKPLKCSLFREEINYLAHKVSKKGVQPATSM